MLCIITRPYHTRSGLDFLWARDRCPKQLKRLPQPNIQLDRFNHPDLYARLRAFQHFADVEPVQALWPHQDTLWRAVDGDNLCCALRLLPLLVCC